MGAAVEIAKTCDDCIKREHRSDGYSVLQCKLGYWRVVLEVGTYPIEEPPTEMPCGGKDFKPRISSVPEPLKQTH
jgi:hypothetical protein